MNMILIMRHYHMEEAELKRNARKILRERKVCFLDIQGSRFTTTGAPDMILVIDGRFIGLEFKTYRGKQSEDQKRMQKRIEDAGGFYFLPRSTQDVLDILDMFS